MYKTNKSILLSRYSRWAVVNDMSELKISINLYYYYNVIPISFDFITFQESTCVTWILAVIIYFDAENRAMDWKENRSKREKYFEWTLKTHISLKMSKKDKKYNECIKWRKILKFQSKKKSDDGFCVFIKKLLFAENTKKPNLRSWFEFPLEVWNASRIFYLFLKY